jgi:HEAT repeats
MKTWCRIVLVAFAAAFLGGVVWNVTKSREPVYQGKTLTEWLEQYDRNAEFSVDMVFGPERVYVTARGVQRPLQTGTSTGGISIITSAGMLTPNLALREESVQAIRQIGTNAIPQLLRLARVEDSAPKAFLLNHLPALGKFMEFAGLGNTYWRRTAKSASAPRSAFIGFKLLGAEAMPAMADLIHLMRVSKNHNGRQAATHAIGFIGPTAQGAVPELVQNLKDPDALVRGAAVSALSDICRESSPSRRFRSECSQVLLPLLTQLLDDPKSDQRTVKFLLGEAGDTRFALRPSLRSSTY